MSPQVARPTEKSYILLEVMIALTVFAIMATSLAQSMNVSIDAANQMHRDAAIRMGLEGMILEAKARPKKEMSFSREDPDLEVNYRTEVEELRFNNFNGERVDHLFLLRALATYKETNGEEQTAKAEIYLYRP